MKAVLTVAAMALVVASCSPSTGDNMSPIKVEIVRTETGYQLLRGGEPYEIHGAGMGRDDIARFARHGGNSIRTWTTLDEDFTIGENIQAGLKSGANEVLTFGRFEGALAAFNENVNSRLQGYT